MAVWKAGCWVVWTEAMTAALTVGTMAECSVGYLVVR